MTERDFYDQLKAFLVTANPELDASQVEPSQNLFNTGVLDSFRIAELIAFVEKLKGEPLALEQTTLHSVSSMENIYRTFFGTA